MQNLHTLISMLAGIAGIFSFLYSIYYHRKEKPNIKTQGAMYILDIRYIQQYVNINQDTETRSISHSSVPDSIKIIYAVVSVCSCFSAILLCLSSLQAYKILLSVLLIIFSILIFYIFIKTLAFLSYRVMQNIAFAGLLLFAVSSFFAILKIDKIRKPSDFTQMSVYDISETISFLFILVFIFIVIIQFFMDLTINYYMYRFLWLDFRKYIYYIFFAVFIYLFATNSFFNTIEYIGNKFFDLLLSIL